MAGLDPAISETSQPQTPEEMPGSSPGMTARQPLPLVSCRDPAFVT